MIRNNNQTALSAEQSIVVACYHESEQAGREVLRHGGNAADAFIASTFVDYVVAPGSTSIAGSINALVYEPTISVQHLSAELKTPSDVKALWSSSNDPPGKSVLIPGAIAGLYMLHSKFGKLPWEFLLEFVINLAETGFVIAPSYSLVLQSRKPILEQSDYARKTFFKNGELLKTGEILK